MWIDKFHLGSATVHIYTLFLLFNSSVNLMTLYPRQVAKYVKFICSVYTIYNHGCPHTVQFSADDIQIGHYHLLIYSISVCKVHWFYTARVDNYVCACYLHCYMLLYTLVCKIIKQQKTSYFSISLLFIFIDSQVHY